MVVAESTRLGDALETLIRDQRVTIAHVVKHGGVSRNTIWLITQGVTTDPEPDTLRKISRGLATDPHSVQFDRPVYVASLRLLCTAAGLPDLTLELPPCDLESEIRSVVKDRSRASVLTAFVRKYPTMTPGERRAVDVLLDHLDDER